MNIEMLSQLTEAERNLGLQRLGRVLAASMVVQGLSTRDVESLTRRMFKVGLSKDSVVKLRKGHTSPSISTYKRLAPVLLKVDHFIYTPEDKIGKPVLVYKGTKYKGVLDKELRIRQALTVEDLPDLDYRYLDYQQIINIVGGEVEYKELKDFAYA